MCRGLEIKSRTFSRRPHWFVTDAVLAWNRAEPDLVSVLDLEQNYVRTALRPYRLSSRGKPVALMLYLSKRCQNRRFHRKRPRPIGRTNAASSASRSNRNVSHEYLKRWVLALWRAALIGFDDKPDCRSAPFGRRRQVNSLCEWTLVEPRRIELLTS